MVKEEQIGGVKKEFSVSMLDSTENDLTMQRSVTEKSAITQENVVVKEGSMVRNPTEKTLHENVQEQSNYDDEVSTVGKKKRQGDSTLLNLENFDKITQHPPSRIKSQAEKIQDYVEEIEKHKRTIEDLTSKLASVNVQVNQNQQTNDKKFAQLEAMIRKNAKKSAGEVISAFNTGRSFAKGSSAGKQDTGGSQNLQIRDPVLNLNLDNMRLNSGASSRRGGGESATGAPKVIFEVHGESLAPTPSLSPPHAD